VKYSPADLMSLFGQSKETIRQWSLVFKPFLSPAASSDLKGQRRFYDDNDLTVFALVHDMKLRKITYDEITLALINGERAELPVTPSTLAKQTDQALALTNQIAELRAELSSSNGQVELLKEQLADTQGRLERLIAENAVLKSRLG